MTLEDRVQIHFEAGARLIGSDCLQQTLWEGKLSKLVIPTGVSP